MFLPKALEHQTRELVYAAGRCNPPLDRAALWLDVRAMLAGVFSVDLLEQERAHTFFEQTYTCIVALLTAAFYDKRCTASEKEAIGELLDQWQGTREVVTENVLQPRSFFSPSEVILAFQYYLEPTDLKVLSQLNLLKAEVAEVFAFVGTVKLDIDDQSVRDWHQYSDNVFMHRLRDFNLTFLHQKGRRPKLIRAERKSCSEFDFCN